MKLRNSRTRTLGALIAAAMPMVAGAQARTGGGVPAGRIAVTLAAPPVTPTPHHGGGFGGQRWPVHTGRPLTNRAWGLAGAYPIVVGSQYQPAAPPPVYVPYPVPYYYPAPARAPEEPKAPPKPYNPELAHMTVIGAGADGGGGVMRIARVGTDSVRLTWLGTTRPIREARLFIADAEQLPLQSRVVNQEHPVGLFVVAPIVKQVAYFGLKVVYKDGSTRTTLVPF